MNLGLIERARTLGLTLAGSVLAVADGERVSATERLTAHGLWAHVDVISGSYAGQPGVPLAAIRDVAAVPGARVDVHVMSDTVDEHVAALISVDVARLTVHVASTADVDRARALPRLAGERWLSVDPAVWSPDDASLGEWDGVVVMLTPPGQPGFAADLARLDTVLRYARRVEVGVDGGVSLDNIDEVAGAGATFVVAGRALLG